MSNDEDEFVEMVEDPEEDQAVVGVRAGRVGHHSRVVSIVQRQDPPSVRRPVETVIDHQTVFSLIRALSDRTDLRKHRLIILEEDFELIWTVLMSEAPRLFPHREYWSLFRCTNNRRAIVSSSVELDAGVRVHQSE